MTEQEKNTKIFNVIDSVLLDLEKAVLLLENWLQDYSFSEKPDARAAVAYGMRVPDDNDIKGYNSSKWFYEYDRIVKTIDIVDDYIWKSKKKLEKAMKDKANQMCQLEPKDTSE